MMLVTGVCNTILNKYQDMQCVRDCDAANPKDRKLFEQPVIQTAQMFIGEMGCWLVVGLSVLYQQFVVPRLGRESSPLFEGGYQPVHEDENEREQALEDVHPRSPRKPAHDGEDRIRLGGWRIFLLAAPSCCDIAGTTLMNVGLLFVAASIYQMTRGALVLFVGLFSVIFLRRKLFLYQWSALFVVVLGVALVGLSGALFGGETGHELSHETGIDAQTTARTPEAVQTIIGVLLIAAAQIFTASQFVLEEWILENYAMDPLQVVGWEGIFGFSVTFIGMIILHFVVGNTDAGRYGYFDMKEGWREITTNRAVAISSILIMISIGGFNFFGLSVTRTVSATSRSTIDTCRTLFIWLVSLGLGWESFKWLQVAGFGLLVYGTFLFNDIVRPPLKACLPSERREGQVLLPEEPIEHI
ncbi:Nucleotide-sugar transporter family protein [Penicillium ucsense]|uniref:Nucleotide-sugar transporter family protein n=1 Tax=Penicillium ucsense TaxID=2839758 RepID=A0A8J8W189_9EURO|nr:Nucleotide-sugar transporter family protein [Penicillium ucsense]KAF7733802.1 Nucleotide-sugar transporter family protein [Penicillium ucsense]